jgi:[protein-PII] uridylyltransferase
LGALFHDIGKGLAGDHSEVGAVLAATALDRMGWPPEDRDEVVALVRHHLLLPDAATRRDLDDPATARFVADRVGTAEQLGRLRALTEADSRATGPTAWSQWKAGLVDDLVARVASVLTGSSVDQLTQSDLGVDRQALVAEARRLAGPVLLTEDRRVIVACPDRPGLFSEMAGALALGGLDVVAATARSEDGVALDEFQVEPAFDREVRWDRIHHDLELALLGRLALTARLAERSRTYERRLASARRLEPTVRVINDLSDEATVIEVVGPDSIGLLHRLASALTELHLDILSAKVTTIGPDAIDAFYVRNADGKVVDPVYLEEVRRGLLHALTG